MDDNVRADSRPAQRPAEGTLQLPVPAQAVRGAAPAAAVAVVVAAWRGVWGVTAVGGRPRDELRRVEGEVYLAHDAVAAAAAARLEADLSGFRVLVRG